MNLIFNANRKLKIGRIEKLRLSRFGGSTALTCFVKTSPMIWSSDQVLKRWYTSSKIPLLKSKILKINKNIRQKLRIKINYENRLNMNK